MGFRQRAAMIFKGIAGAIRKEPSLTALCLFVLLNIWLVGVQLPGKGIILLVSLAALLLFLFWRDDWRWLDRFRRGWLCFSLHSLEENAHTLATWALLAFFLSIFTVNGGWIWPGRYLLLGFVALGMLSALLLLIALMRNENQTLKKAGYILGAAVPVIYAITSSYAASDFYMMSGIKLDDSPVLNLWVKALYFSVWFYAAYLPRRQYLLSGGDERQQAENDADPHHLLFYYRAVDAGAGAVVRQDHGGNDGLCD